MNKEMTKSKLGLIIFDEVKKYINSQDLKKDLKSNKIKKGETVWLDEREKNKFKISIGNKKVLELIPSMMENKEFRRELRLLTLNFLNKKKVKK